jgi:hypothetical protein
MGLQANSNHDSLRYAIDVCCPWGTARIAKAAEGAMTSSIEWHLQQRRHGVVSTTTTADHASNVTWSSNSLGQAQASSESCTLLPGVVPIKDLSSEPQSVCWYLALSAAWSQAIDNLTTWPWISDHHTQGMAELSTVEACTTLATSRIRG